MNRNSLRNSKLFDRDQIAPVRRQEKSQQIYSLLINHPVITKVDNFFIYVNFRSEVETKNLINQLLAASKTISVPVTLLKSSSLLAVQLTNPDSQLTPGCYGIPEPTAIQIARATVDPATIQTVLIPGSVFDTTGGRLGYGGGFYDRFLTESAPQATRVALAFEQQMVEQVPMQPHDQYMDIIVTEQQIYDCKRIRNA